MTHGILRASACLLTGIACVAHATEDPIPINDAKATLEYLQKKRYSTFAVAEPEIHPSKNVHGVLIRTFLNKEMAEGLRDRRKELPRNSTAVKEVYTPDGKLDGWSVSVKTSDESRHGAQWYWYEIVGIADGGPGHVSANSLGGKAGICVSCHQSGYDYVLTRLPLAAR